MSHDKMNKKGSAGPADQTKEKSKEATKSDDPKDFSALFTSYSKFSRSKEEGKISLNNIQKWFQQAKTKEMEACINDETVSHEYERLFKDKAHITQAEFESLLGAIAGSKKMDKRELMDKLVEAGEPKISNIKDVIAKVR